jgi:galactokinase
MQVSEILEGLSRGVPASWRAVYGSDAGVLDERRALVQEVCQTFLERFGDRPVRLFRAPGRINLRGMHVDTHGGYLNLMTHQREVVVAASPADDGECALANISASFADVHLDLHALRTTAGEGAWPWWMARTGGGQPGHGWAAYVTGALLRAQFIAPDTPFNGMCAVVGSDLPRGAALSSSHALSTVLLQATLALNGHALDPGACIRAVRDVEWYAGARTGTSDQGAMILGRRGEVVHGVLYPEDLSLDQIVRYPLPPGCRVLVINSHTRRSLSGAQRAGYTRNRVAYSLALGLLREAMRQRGYPAALVHETDRLARVSAARLGGDAALFELLQAIPLHATLAAVCRVQDTGPEAIERVRALAADAQIDEEEQLPLRGPLLFGVAESERARRFGAALAEGDLVRMGHFMRIGHDGDRRISEKGKAFEAPCDDGTLAAWAGEGKCLADVPGQYGASSPALDTLVDAALGAGALGACLTGAGIAGAVLALVREEDAGHVASQMRATLATPVYARRAQLRHGLSGDDIAAAVVINHSANAAGELPS